MDSGALRGFVGKVMKLVDFSTFLDMREVCRMWWKESENCRKQWLWWMKRYGEAESIKYKLKYHYLNGKQDNWGIPYNQCHALISGEPCGQASHHAKATRVPKILKTVPLHRQVMHQLIKRRYKRVKTRLGAAIREKEHAETLLSVARNEIALVTEQNTFIEHMRECYPPVRKKGRISLQISK